MIIQELYKALGIDLKAYNLIVDYTLVNGVRAHKAMQVLANGIIPDDKMLVTQVKSQLPQDSRICSIVEIKGDFELSELSDLAESVAGFIAPKRTVYLDQELHREYIEEIKRGIL
jgi:hypothetical protein